MFLGDASFFDRDLARYRNASAEALQRAAGEWLQPEQRIVLSVVPRGQAATALEGSLPVAVS